MASPMCEVESQLTHGCVTWRFELAYQACSPSRQAGWGLKNNLGDWFRTLSRLQDFSRAGLFLRGGLSPHR